MPAITRLLPALLPAHYSPITRNFYYNKRIIKYFKSFYFNTFKRVIGKKWAGNRAGNRRVMAGNCNLRARAQWRGRLRRCYPLLRRKKLAARLRGRLPARRLPAPRHATHPEQGGANANCGASSTASAAPAPSLLSASAGCYGIRPRRRRHSSCVVVISFLILVRRRLLLLIVFNPVRKATGVW